MRSRQQPGHLQCAQNAAGAGAQAGPQPGPDQQPNQSNGGAEDVEFEEVK